VTQGSTRRTGPRGRAARKPSPWWRSTWFEIAQFLALAAGAVWLVWRGVTQMDYRWQWYRIPRFFYKEIDGELIWGPLVNGALVTLEIAGWGLILTLLIGLVVALLRLSGSISGKALAMVYL